MKLFRILLVVLLFFFVSCEGNGGTRLIPVDDEAEKSDTGDTEGDTGDTEGDTGDTTGDTGDSDTGDSDTGDSDTGDSDTGNSDTGDSDTGDSDTGDSDTGDSDTGDSDTGDSDTGDSDTGDSDTGDSDTGDSDTGDSDTGDSDTGDSDTGDSDTGDSDTGDSDTGDSDTGDSDTGDSDTGDSDTGDSDTGDSDTGDSGIVCPENTVNEGGVCKPYCSAVFNGTSSKIEVADNDLLNLGTEWTIEAWIKQSKSDVTSDAASIIRKSAEEKPAYVLAGFYKNSNRYAVAGQFKYQYSSFGTKTDNLQVVKNDLTSVPSGWTHVALEMSNKHLRLYVNGTMVKDESTTRNITSSAVSGALTIGVNAYENAGIMGYGAVSPKYFKGMIDSIKISSSAKFNGTGFTPAKLEADGSTVALWDFSNNAKDSSSNGLDGVATNITYSTDCR